MFVSAAALQYLTLFMFLALLDDFPQFCENKAGRVFFFVFFSSSSSHFFLLPSCRQTNQQAGTKKHTTSLLEKTVKNIPDMMEREVEGGEGGEGRGLVVSTYKGSEKKRGS